MVLIGQSDIKGGAVLPHEAGDCSRRETERRTRLPYIKDLNQGRKPVVTGGPYPIPGAKLR